MGNRFLATDTTEATNQFTAVAKSIANLINNLLTPIMILVGAAGTIYAVVLGVNFAKAETSDKREEAKKRLINAVIGIVIIFILLIILKIVCANMENIISAIAPDKY